MKVEEMERKGAQRAVRGSVNEHRVQEPTKFVFKSLEKHPTTFVDRLRSPTLKQFCA